MKKSRADIRKGVKSRIRKKVQGTTERPRLAVFRSLNHIYAQVIDDAQGKTLAAASTTEKDLGIKLGGNVEAAQTIGKTIAERAQAAGVSQVVFDRGGYVYHGRVKALLDASREAGLNKNEVHNTGADESASEESSAAENTLDSVTSAVGSVIGTVIGTISNLLGDVAETPAENSREKDAQNISDVPEAQTEKVKEESNENE